MQSAKIWSKSDLMVFHMRVSGFLATVEVMTLYKYVIFLVLGHMRSRAVIHIA